MSETAIVAVDLKVFDAGLVKFKQAADSIVVKDQQDYIAACQLALDVRAYCKDVKAKLNPGIESAKSHLDFLKNERQKYLTPAEAIDTVVSHKAESWKRAEREAAERERQRIQQEAEAQARQKAEEERREAERVAKEAREARERELEAQRKAGEIGKREQARLAKIAAEEQAAANLLAQQQAAETAANVPQIKVEASVPKVAGIKARVNWKFRIVDASKIPHLFLMPDEVAIGQEVRRLKDKAKAEEVISGIEVWNEDGI